MSRALPRLFAALTALTLAVACGDKDATDDTASAQLVPDGTFTLDYVSADGFTDADFAGLTITIDRASMTATLTEDLDGATPQVLSLTEVPEEEWIKDCYTMDSHSVSEVFTVSPDPVVIGALSIPTPGLTTKCGGRVLLGSVVGGEVVDPTLGFTE